MRNAILMLIFFLAGAVACTAVVEDAQVKIRDASNYDINAPEARFLNQNPDPAEPGGYVEVRIKVENIGTEAANEMYFELIPEYPFSLDPGKASNVRLGDTDARQVGVDAYVLYWSLRVDKDAVEGSSRLRMRYSVDSGKTWVEPDEYYIRIQTHDSIISIESAEAKPEVVEPGKELTLEIVVKNMADSLLKDVRTNLNLIYPAGTTLVELPFTPIGSSNEKAVKSIEKGQTEAFSFRMIADIDAESGIYKIPVVITYSDKLGKNYSVTGLVGARIGASPDLYIGTDMPQKASSSREAEITVRFVNKGKEDINFLFASLGEVEGVEYLSSKEFYVGNIDSDDYESEDVRIKVSECDKEYEIPVRVGYLSPSNEKYEEETKLMVIPCKGSASESSSGTKSAVGIAIIVVIVAAALIAYRAFRKRKE